LDFLLLEDSSCAGEDGDIAAIDGAALGAKEAGAAVGGADGGASERTVSSKFPTLSPKLVSFKDEGPCP